VRLWNFFLAQNFYKFTLILDAKSSYFVHWCLLMIEILLCRNIADTNTAVWHWGHTAVLSGQTKFTPTLMVFPRLCPIRYCSITTVITLYIHSWFWYSHRNPREHSSFCCHGKSLPLWSSSPDVPRGIGMIGLIAIQMKMKSARNDTTSLFDIVIW